MRLNLLAWRTLQRNKRRTLITALSVAFGVLLAVTFTASGDYSYTNMINTSAAMGLGHITCAPQEYNETPTLEKRLRDAAAIRREVTAARGVNAAYVRIIGPAMLASGAKSTGGTFMAIDPAAETPEHNMLLRNIVEGALFAVSTERGVVVGRRMAEKLGLKIGKKLIFTVTDKNGELTSALSRVTGIFHTGDDGIDGGIVLLPLDFVRRTLQYEPQEASLVAVYIADQRQASTLAQRLSTAIHLDSGEALFTWKETQADLAGLIAVDRLFNYLMQFLVGLVIAAGIMNTILMSVMERSREFGIMIALGMAPAQVTAMVLVESFWIGICGLLLGAVITTPWFVYMSKVGIDFSSHIGTDYSAGGVLVDPVVRFRLYGENALIIMAAVLVLTLLAGLYPAVRAGRLPPVESMKQD